MHRQFFQVCVPRHVTHPNQLFPLFFEFLSEFTSISEEAVRSGGCLLLAPSVSWGFFSLLAFESCICCPLEAVTASQKLFSKQIRAYFKFPSGPWNKIFRKERLTSPPDGLPPESAKHPSTEVFESSLFCGVQKWEAAVDQNWRSPCPELQTPDEERVNQLDCPVGSAKRWLHRDSWSFVCWCLLLFQPMGTWHPSLRC